MANSTVLDDYVDNIELTYEYSVRATWQFHPSPGGTHNLCGPFSADIDQMGTTFPHHGVSVKVREGMGSSQLLIRHTAPSTPNNIMLVRRRSGQSAMQVTSMLVNVDVSSPNALASLCRELNDIIFFFPQQRAWPGHLTMVLRICEGGGQQLEAAHGVGDTMVPHHVISGCVGNYMTLRAIEEEEEEDAPILFVGGGGGSLRASSILAEQSTSVSISQRDDVADGAAGVIDKSESRLSFSRSVHQGANDGSVVRSVNHAFEDDTNRSAMVNAQWVAQGNLSNAAAFSPTKQPSPGLDIQPASVWTLAEPRNLPPMEPEGRTAWDTPQQRSDVMVAETLLQRLGQWLRNAHTPRTFQGWLDAVFRDTRGDLTHDMARVHGTHTQLRIIPPAQSFPSPAHVVLFTLSCRPLDPSLSVLSTNNPLRYLNEKLFFSGDDSLLKGIALHVHRNETELDFIVHICHLAPVVDVMRKQGGFADLAPDCFKLLLLREGAARRLATGAPMPSPMAAQVGMTREPSQLDLWFKYDGQSGLSPFISFHVERKDKLLKEAQVAFFHQCQSTYTMFAPWRVAIYNDQSGDHKVLRFPRAMEDYLVTLQKYFDESWHSRDTTPTPSQVEKKEQYFAMLDTAMPLAPPRSKR